MPDMNPGYYYFPVSFVCISNCLLQYSFKGKAPAPAPGIRYNTVRAEVVAAVLNLQERAGPAVKTGYVQAFECVLPADIPMPGL